MDPFLPWPGSKQKCARAIIDEFPQSFGTYFEPFLGSGAVFFAMDEGPTRRSFDRARLSDVNRNLISCWTGVRDRPEHVKRMLEHCLQRNSNEFYNSMRSQMENPSVFLYVMRAAFSSMYRENLQGCFNVPWRKQDFEVNKKPISFDTAKIDACSVYIRERNVDLSVDDFIKAVQAAKAGDVVYFDPPYCPFAENGFTSYSATDFKEGSHVFLRTQARLLAERGVFVALSNSLVPDSIRLYGEPTKTIIVPNSVKAKATEKGVRQEGLWIWRPKTT